MTNTTVGNTASFNPVFLFSFFLYVSSNVERNDSRLLLSRLRAQSFPFSKLLLRTHTLWSVSNSVRWCSRAHDMALPQSPVIAQAVMPVSLKVLKGLLSLPTAG